MSESGSSRNYVLQVVLALAVVFLLVAFGRMRSEMKEMREENARLREQGVRPAAPETAADQLPAQTQEQAPVVVAAASEPAGAGVAAVELPEDLVSTPTGFAPPPRTSGLTLAGTHAAPVAGGLKATMRFNPTTDDVLGIVAVVVRLPLDNGSRILELGPQGSVGFTDTSKRVAENGKFAIFQGTPAEAKALEFFLTVTEPTVADVRGTAGIGPMNLRIAVDGASVAP